MRTQNHRRGPRGCVRGTTSLWVRTRAVQRSILGRGAAPAPGGDERGARASYQCTCSLHTRHHDCWDRSQERWRHLGVRVTALIRQDLRAPCLCVFVPFSRGSRRHTVGLLEVELARTDGVCRLWQADAAISEELETSSRAGFLKRKKNAVCWYKAQQCSL